jgi:hypothetical protein
MTAAADLTGYGVQWLASYLKSGNTWFRTFLRNPLDMAVSMASHNGTDIDTAKRGLNNRRYALSMARAGLRPQVRQSLGTWSDHVTNWVDAPGLACHPLRYEDMTQDPENALPGPRGSLVFRPILIGSPRRSASAVSTPLPRRYPRPGSASVWHGRSASFERGAAEPGAPT